MQKNAFKVKKNRFLANFTELIYAKLNELESESECAFSYKDISRTFT